MKLTKRVIDGLETRDKEYLVSDSELRGFFVRVRPSGTKTYVAQYRVEGKVKRYKIGAHGVLTTEEARTIARGILGDVAKGEDPVEERVTKRKAMTVAGLCELYMKAAKAGQIRGKGGRSKRESTQELDRGRVDNYIVPLLGSKRVMEVRHTDIRRFLEAVTRGDVTENRKTEKLRGRSIVRGGEFAATRAVGLLGSMMSFAVAEGIIEINPCRNLNLAADRKRERRLKPKEFFSLGTALREAEKNGENKRVIIGTWLLALTGCRRNEIIELEWDEIDYEGQCFRLKDSKEGASVRPIGKAVFSILRSVGKIENCPYVLSSVRSDGRYFAGFTGGFERIIKQAGLKNENVEQNVTPHVLRHSYASVAADMGFPDTLIASLLGHSTNTPTSRYINRLHSSLIEAADAVAEEVLKQMSEFSNETMEHISE